MRSLLIGLSTLSFIALSTLSFADAPAPSAAPANAAPQQAAAPQPAAAPQQASAPAANPAQGTPATASPQQALQIENTVHQYLLKQPEVVVEALQAYQQKQMQSMQDMYKETQKVVPQYVNDLFHDNADPVSGDISGKITMVEFTDYQCSHCIEMSTVVEKALQGNPKFRLVVKEFPIRGALSETAACAALAANKQGKYWPFHLALYKVGSALTEDKIYETAKSVGLNVDKLKKDMNDPAIKAQVAATKKLATSLKLIGTPAFFVAKTDIKMGAPSADINYVPGILSQEQLQAILDKAAL